MKIKIRAVRDQDLEQLAEIYQEAFSSPHSHETWDYGQALRCIKFLFRRNKKLALTATDEKGKVLGGVFGDIWPYYNGDYLNNVELFIDAKHQNHNIGSRLALAIYKKARDKFNASFCSFLTLSANKRLVNWYKKQGFRVCKELPVIESDIATPIAYLENLLYLS